jgi:nucleotide-binding universal stress UspA family protein
MGTAVSIDHSSEAKTRDITTQGHRILVCVDRSKPADGCLAHAIVLARALGSELTLVHVLQPLDQVGSQHDVLDWEIARQEAHAHLERLVDQVTRALGRAPDVRLEQGRAPERIVELMREIGADLTVLGSHGDGATLLAAGARPQRLLWASTGTKDPTAPDTLYIEALAAPDTIDTIPDKTLEAFADHGELRGSMAIDGGDADAVVGRFAAAGIEVDALAAKLQRDGDRAFVKSWQELLGRIADKAAALAGSEAR